jgi:hypothetical protein
VALMTQQRNTIRLSRQQVGQIGSYVGGTALLMGILGLIWTGFSTLTIVAFALAAAGLGAWATFAPRDFRAFISGRQARFGSIAFFSTLLLVGIIAMTYLLVRQSALNFDLTQSGQFTLSPETQQVLSRITRPMQITGFYSPRALPLREIDDQFFRLYETASSGLIQRQYIDPETAPAVADRFGVFEEGDLYLSYLNADGTIDFNTLSRIPRDRDLPNQEREITEAILRLLVSGTITVYFDTSHGTRDALDASQEGLLGVHNGMQETGIGTAPVDIAAVATAGGDVPADAAALIMARPITDYTEAEVGVLDRYLDRGGSLLILADVLFNEDRFLRAGGIFSNYLWANFGIRALDAAVVDPAASSGTALDVLSAAVVSDTVTSRLNPETDPALFRLARAIEVAPAAAQPTVANGQFIASSNLAYGETNLQQLGETNTYAFDDGIDPRGPLTLAAWAFDQATGAKIVVIGDSDFASNGRVLETGGNGILFTDSVTWLTDLNEQITFAPQAVGFGLPLIMDPATQNGLLFITVILIPGIILVTGLAIYARRARQ